jgi:hypothetical protein
VAWGDLRVPDADGAVSHLQFSLTASDDRAVLSRFNSMIGTLQVGHTGSRHQVLVGDVLATPSRLAGGIGLKGALGTYSDGGFSAIGFAGDNAESWETLLDRETNDGSPTRRQFTRRVHGGALSYQVGSGLQAFVTHQGFSDRAAAVSPAVAAGLLPTHDGRASTFGANYTATIPSLGQLRVSGEHGRSSYATAGASSSSDAASLLDLALSTNVGPMTVAVRGGRTRVGAEWRSAIQTLTPGLDERYAGADISWDGLHLSQDVRRAANDISVLGYNPELESHTTRAAWSPSFLSGWTFSALRSVIDTTTGPDQSQSVQRELGLERKVGMWSFSVAATSLDLRYALYPYADGTTREYRGAIRAGLDADWLSRANLQAATFGFSLGHQRQQTAYPTETSTRIAAVQATVSTAPNVTYSIDLGRRFTRDLLAGDKFSSGVIELQHQRALASGLALRAYFRKSRAFRGLLTADVMERVGGISLSYQW